MLMQSFAPLTTTNGLFANSTAIAITAANQVWTLPATAAGSTGQMRVFNNSTQVIFVTPGNSVALAVAVAPTAGVPANGYAIAAGEDTIITLPPGVIAVGVIGTSTTGTAYFTQGEGV
jgi:hypothetical protein